MILLYSRLMFVSHPSIKINKEICSYGACQMEPAVGEVLSWHQWAAMIGNIRIFLWPAQAWSDKLRQLAQRRVRPSVDICVAMCKTGYFKKDGVHRRRCKHSTHDLLLIEAARRFPWNVVCERGTLIIRNVAGMEVICSNPVCKV